MLEWSKQTGFDIFKGVYFPNKVVEDLVQLRMACGEAVVTLKMAERGNTMLVCNLCSMAATSEARIRDEAAVATETTLTM